MTVTAFRETTIVSGKSVLGGVSCNSKASKTSRTQYKKPETVHDPGKDYTFNVATQTYRGTGPGAETQWRGELYRLAISARQFQGNDITPGFNTLGFPCSRKFEAQGRFGDRGK